MIDSISGKIAKRTDETSSIVVLTANGIGYRMTIPERRIDASVKLLKGTYYTHDVYTEFTRKLYGFESIRDRDLFQKILGAVKGVGPSAAMNLFNKLTADEICQAIVDKDAKTLKSCKGIGRTAADNIIRVLEGKFPDYETSTGEAVKVQREYDKDAVATLRALGYKAAAALEAVKKVQDATDEELSTEEIVKRTYQS